MKVSTFLEELNFILNLSSMILILSFDNSMYIILFILDIGE